MPKNKTQKSLNTGKIQTIHGMHAVRAALLNTKRAHQELHVSENNHKFANNYKSKIKKITILDHKAFKKLYGGEKASQGIVLKTNDLKDQIFNNSLKMKMQMINLCYWLWIK